MTPAKTQASYRAVDPTFWIDLKVQGWDDDTRLLALFLLTCPSSSDEGFFALRRVLLLDHLGWSEDRLRRALDRLRADDFAMYDDQAQAVLIVRALKYRAPKKGSHTVAAVRKLKAVRDAPALFDRFLAAAEKYAPHLADAIRDEYQLR